ncbi:RagB/SusD family nutrient uptake outer membrane protein [Chitinophagaceae bacterium LB-8]|uniref:RagB/SusD family nutrient uptake outer membrane protein n=1 Tax=Paraflavisolibacter caeni TaxID=2982496 RepID=A0A9X2XT79_9BACT|nr:RagB/SusD family nutrient uptake outer membrane protein [Paraflavisolibacter caeni]MCU7547891.1 RagB/SusD family nutrient uptake outer membrane protein [Paraflavisolibacter caeni]
MRIINRINILICVVAISMLVSCKKSYLETTATDRISEDIALKTTDGCWKLLNGIHRILYTSHMGRQDRVGQGANMMDMDAMGDDITLSSVQDWYIAPYLWYNTNRNQLSALVYFNYFFYYEIINNANLLIDNVKASKGSEEDKKAILGQAYAYRGWAYFQMIQLYGERFNANGTNTGLGLRIVRHSQEPVKPRASVAVVYNLINSDLDSAILLLDGYKRANKSHLNQSVAQGFKARVALTQQNWSTAATMAAAARSGYALMDSVSYMSGFNDNNNPEWMWGSHQQENQTTYFASFFAYMSCNFPSQNIISSPRAMLDSVYRLIPSTDVRWQLWDSTGANLSFPVPKDASGKDVGTRVKFMQRKFKVANPELSIGDLPLMRASEMYLIEAEANAQMGNSAKAAAALYPLAKQRDAAYMLSTKTGTALLNEISFQRRIELWGEGFRFYDLKRLNQPLDRSRHTFYKSYQKSVPAGDIKWQFLIPQAEIDASGKIIEQNPL